MWQLFKKEINTYLNSLIAYIVIAVFLTGIGLLGLDPDLLEHDALGVRGAPEGIGLPPGAQMGLLVVEVGPHLGATVLDVLAGGLQTPGFTHDEAASSKVKGREKTRPPTITAKRKRKAATADSGEESEGAELYYILL